MSSVPGSPSCNPHVDPPVSGDCWYNCTLDDIAGEDKRRRLRKVCFFVLFSCSSSSSSTSEMSDKRVRWLVYKFIYVYE